MDNEKFQKDITKRLDTIIRLLAASSMKESNLTEKIYFLNKSGFSPKEISEILNTSGNYVNVILSNMRRKERKDIHNDDRKNVEEEIYTQTSEVQNG